MRAMRKITLASLALLSCVAAACGSNPGVHDMGMADMSLGPDMAMKMPNGVACGQMTCAVGKECCVSVANNMVTGATCIDSGGMCNGSALACDGPEDCNKNATDVCCSTINFMTSGNADAGITFTGGKSTCGSCTAMLGFTSLTTRLCHSGADCTNFSATLLGQKLTFDKCCSQGSTTGGLQFCAPDPSTISGLTGGMAGYTCQ
jgi:hypothetical protein